MIATSDVISSIAAAISLGSLGVAVSANRKNGPRLKLAAKLQKSARRTAPKLEINIFNTGLAATRMKSIHLVARDLFGPIEVASAAVLEGPRGLDGYEIGANDGARWLIDLQRVLYAATDSEIADEYYRYRSLRQLPRVIMQDISSFLMSASVVFLPRAMKGELLQAVVVFRNGVEVRKPVTTGWALQVRLIAPPVREELRRRDLLRRRTAVRRPSGSR